jgi:hypothetical protein
MRVPRDSVRIPTDWHEQLDRDAVVFLDVLSDLIGKRYRVAGLSWRYRRRSYKSDHGLSPVFKSFTRSQLKGTAAYGTFNYPVDRFEPFAAESVFDC